MSEHQAYSIPTWAELAEADPKAFLIWNGPDESVPVERIDLAVTKAMTAQYECFSVMFALPQGIHPAQGVYPLGGPDGQRWLLLMSPVLSEADGRHVLEAVIHRKIQA
ncbi:DUF6916 family protein [Pseudomonas sp.]|uniref:DUF6916 family protein n=1 Tax=Pseudomonas sp. TaxID=306 RepID=UPI003D6E5C08